MSLRAAARQLSLLSGVATNAAQQTRAMGSSAVTYKGVTIHDASFGHKFGAEVLGGLMWSWLLIRFYEDGETLLFGHNRHFEHELHEMAHPGEGHHAEHGILEAASEAVAELKESAATVAHQVEDAVHAAQAADLSELKAEAQARAGDAVAAFEARAQKAVHAAEAGASEVLHAVDARAQEAVHALEGTAQEARDSAAAAVSGAGKE